MEFSETIDDNSKSLHFKTKTIGPCSLDNYRDIKLKELNDKDFNNYYINWIRTNNNYIYRVIEVTKYYLINENTVITDNYLICINRIPKSIKNRKNIKSFGAKDDDFGSTTTLSNTRVFLIPPDIEERDFSKKMNKIYDEYDTRIGYIHIDKFKDKLSKIKKDNNVDKSDYKKLNKINSNIMEKNSNSKFKLFKPNIKAISMLERINKRSSENTASKSKYLPPGMRNKSSSSPGSNTIVVKNIPTEIDMTIKEVNNQLRDMFRKYGMIDRVKTLTAKEDNRIILKGIAFIDFYDSKSVEAALSDNSTRHKLGYSILLIEKKNN